MKVPTDWPVTEQTQPQIQRNTNTCSIFLNPGQLYENAKIAFQISIGAIKENNFRSAIINKVTELENELNSSSQSASGLLTEIVENTMILM